MNCEEIRDLVPAYALGTATDDETARVERHFAECDLHEDVVDVQATAMLVGAGTEPTNPPSSLRARIFSGVSGSGEAENRVAPVAGRHRYRRFLVANPLAAVLVVALGMMAVWNIMLQGADTPERFVHYYWGNDDDWMRIETVLGDPGAEVSLGGVERLDDTHRYHLWTTRGDVVLKVGAFNVNPEGRWAGEFDFTFEEGDRVWMTTEPTTGSEQPTGETVLRTRF